LARPLDHGFARGDVEDAQLRNDPIELDLHGHFLKYSLEMVVVDFGGCMALSLRRR